MNEKVNVYIYVNKYVTMTHNSSYLNSQKGNFHNAKLTHLDRFLN